MCCMVLVKRIRYDIDLKACVSVYAKKENTICIITDK